MNTRYGDQHKVISTGTESGTRNRYAVGTMAEIRIDAKFGRA